MTSQVYYRSWRPRSFAELVGQEHVSTTLRQSVRQGRVSHAYLFCGPRGSGKTTTARIIAKAANCLGLQDGDPCNVCTICQAINDGRFMDIIELDAASNRGIDEIRDIREKVNFSPAQGSRKVYIIDEAHMLTDAAANAFLKTLEEPPGHVIFVLCTTEARKILPTIVSRCQRFDFRRIPSELIYRRLAEMVEAEGAVVEDEALRLVARYASGSLRDAQNLLEQLVVSCSDGVGLSQVEDLLGLGHGERWLDLVRYLLMGNTAASLGVINEAAWDGIDLRQLHRQTQDLLRAVLHLQWNSGQSLDLADHVVAQLGELVGQLPPWRIAKALKTWGEVNMRYDAPSTLPLELAAVEICGVQAAPPTDMTTSMSPDPVKTSPPATPRATPAARAETPEGTDDKESVPAPPVAAQPQRTASPAAVARSPDTLPRETAPTTSPSTGQSDLVGAWAATVRTLARQRGNKYFLGALLKDCRPDAIYLEGDTLCLPFAHRTHMERMQEEMDDPKGRCLVSDVINQCFGRSYEIKLILIENNGAGSTSTVSAQNSPLVRAAMGMGARILKEVAE
jgi:DNA polymerase-3 subunit gamma/tau